MLQVSDRFQAGVTGLTHSRSLNEIIRDDINALGGKFASIEFVKKDGSLRTLVVQRNAEPVRVLGTDRGIQASATRKANHPNFMSVYSVDAQGWRTVNLDTVIAVKSGGRLRRYRTPIGPRAEPLVSTNSHPS